MGQNIVLQGNSEIVADAVEGDGGNINITTQGFFVSADSDISASSQFGLDGNVRVETINGDRNLELAILPTNLINVKETITVGCNSRNNFALAGKGGLPQNPSEQLRGETVWQDLRLVEMDSKRSRESKNKRVQRPYQPIVEAQAWKINHSGNIELIALNSASVALDHDAGCPSLD
ncbi:hypothetical protein H1P_5470003 [Hyella patelloides LEGE 07179]|uniref:Uncharacterized protein n=1 Tax=Hyella patelloides LEGE 07179 TaxID=945734 RepID=A0A563W0D8_9CYAN|nr:hypothetical protein [Hyella patelloides]VEP17087.1 hypothetical protein H1P_5470003 [Hyella patelloides LEGE 07179]